MPTYQISLPAVMWPSRSGDQTEPNVAMLGCALASNFNKFRIVEGRGSHEDRELTSHTNDDATAHQVSRHTGSVRPGLVAPP